MDNFDHKPLDQAAGSDLQAQVAALQNTVNILLVLVLLATGAVDVFFWRLLRQTRAERDALRNIVTEYQKSAAPATDKFLADLIDFGRTHADFDPILIKYRLKLNPTAAPPAKASAPAKATAPAPKK